MSEGRLTDERLIELVAKHDRLGREAGELGRLIAAHKEMIGAAEGGVAPRRASSLAEYNRLTTESRTAVELARGEIGEVRAREANLRRAQGEVLQDLAAGGMPLEVWFRHGDEGVLLMVRNASPPSLRRALWEAVEKSPEGASVQEVEALSRKIEARRNRSLATRAAPVVIGGVVAAPSLAGLFAFHWYLDPTLVGTAILVAVGVVAFLVLFGLLFLVWDWLAGAEQDADDHLSTILRSVEGRASDPATRETRGGAAENGGGGYHAATNPALSGTFDGGSDRSGADHSGEPSSGGSSGGYDGGGSFSGGGDSGGGAL